MTALPFELFRFINDPAPPPILARLPVVAGLCAACWFARIACPVPRLHDLSWPALGLLAVRYSAATCAAAALACWGVFAFIVRRPGCSLSAAFRFAAGVAFIPPAAILLKGKSAWLIVPGVLLAATLTKAVVAYVHTLDQNEGERAAESLWAGVSASTFAHLAALAGMGGYVVTASILLGAAAAAATRALSRSGLMRPRVRIAPTMACGMLFTAASLTPYLEGGSRFLSHGGHTPALLEWVAAILRVSSGAEKPGDAEEDFEQPPRVESVPIVLGEAYPGVVLWPEVAPHTILVPPLPSMGHHLFGAATSAAAPLSIPFYGVYSLFKVSDGRLPRNSFRLQGSPEKLGLVSTDHTPLHMEARQNLGVPVDMDCCSSIQIAIRNRDIYWGSISLELIVTDTTTAAKSSQSLGRAEVRSRWPSGPGNRRAYAPETVTFALPAVPLIRQFDDIRIVFHLATVRSERSAKIAIERFILVPRASQEAQRGNASHYE